MPETVGYDNLVAMLRAAIGEVREHRDALSKLDSFGGDGDHGTTMARGMGLVEKAIDDASSRELTTLLSDIAWAIMGVDGGATGPLLGMFFMGMSDTVAGKESLDAAALATMFAAGLASIEKQTKARVGDKTLIDALAPAVDALRAAADEGAEPAAALARAAQAAEQGAAATAGLQARFGRAKNLGERSKGHPDPGATSMSLIFRGFAHALVE